MDGIGIRPALDPIAQRIADHGYFVVLPDMFYRVGPYVAPDPAKLFADPELRAEWFKKIGAARNQDNLRADIEAFLAFFDRQSDVKGPKVGTTGYCMGGRISVLAAGWFPERIAAAGSFHPAGLATDDADSPHLLASQMKAKVYVGGASDDPTSPHLLAPKIKARVYVAGAIEDANFPDEQKQKLDEALTAAGVQHVIETYPARHGWVPSDTPVHDPAQADRHYSELFKLFDETLRG